MPWNTRPSVKDAMATSMVVMSCDLSTDGFAARGAFVDGLDALDGAGVALGKLGNLGSIACGRAARARDKRAPGRARVGV